jgi:type I restriction enzyme, S subunit
LVKDSILPSGNENLIYIGLEHINQGTYTLNGIGTSDVVESNKFKFKVNDILFGKLRPYFKKVYYSRFDGICSTDIWVIRAKEGIEQRFLFYLIASDEFVELSVAGSNGTKMPRADWNHLKNSFWNIPPLSEQQAIAFILSSLDDKIELNRKQNETLEKIAQAIFKHWFVDFEFPNEGGKPYKSSGGEMIESELGLIPKGWRILTLNDLIHIKHGFAFSGEYFQDDENENILLTPGNFKIGGGFNSNKYKFYNGEIPNDYILNEDDLIITMTDLSVNGDTLGFPALVPTIQSKILLHNQRLGKVIINNNSIEKGFLYQLLLQDNYRQYILSGATGTTVRHTSPNRISSYKFILPSQSILKIYERIFTSLRNKEKINFLQSNTLSKLRDELLPKLMSGKVRVKSEK